MSPLMVSPRMPMAMGMGMGLGMGMITPNRYPVVPHPPNYPCSAIPPQAGQRFMYGAPPVPIPRPPPKKVSSQAKMTKNA